MNYKPDEGALIAYLYGELDGAELEKMEDYLRRNPEEKRRIADWSLARKVMTHLPDKEVIAPPIIWGEDKERGPFWKESYFRMSLGIAASLLFVLVAAKILGLSAGYSQGELRIGFGIPEKQPIPAVQQLTEEKVRDMIHSSLTTNNEVLKTSWVDDRKALEQSIHNDLKSNSGRIDKLMTAASAASEDQVRRFVAQLQSDNLKLMKDYVQLSSTAQKQYVEGLLVDFSKYLQEQRNQDMQFLQTRVTSIEQNTDQFKQETEQILTSLITNTGTNNQRKN